MPAAFDPTTGHGVRQNLAFEAAAVARDGRHLFVGMEGALVQDGPAASLAGGSLSRILRYNLSTGKLDRQYVYGTDPVAKPPVTADAVLRERSRRTAPVQHAVHAGTGRWEWTLQRRGLRVLTPWIGVGVWIE